MFFMEVDVRRVALIIRNNFKVHCYLPQICANILG